MRILITGDRDWSDPAFIEKKFLELKNLYPGNEEFVILNCGSLGGVDATARVIARKYKLEFNTYRANYEKYDRTANALRNSEIIKEGKPRIIFIFHPKPEKSESLQDLITKAKRRKIPINIFYGDPNK